MVDSFADLRILLASRSHCVSLVMRRILDLLLFEFVAVSLLHRSQCLFELMNIEVLLFDVVFLLLEFAVVSLFDDVRRLFELMML